MARLLIAGLAGVALAGAVQGRAPTTERLGPFELGPGPERRLTVVAAYRTATNAPPGDDKTLASWRIQDAAAAVLFERTIDHSQQDNESVAITRATVLHGPSRRFLLVELGYLPSAPSAGAVYHVFGFDRRGRLREMAKLAQYGKGVLNAPDAAGRLALAEGRYLDLGVWTSWFAMTFRYAYDEGREAFVPHNRCAPVREAVFSRELREELAARRDNVVALYARPEDPSPRERVVVTPAHRIEPLEACVPAPPAEGDVAADTVVLRVRIDGKEGWVRAADFHRLGIQQAG